MPLGVTQKSYAYSSTGKIANDARVLHYQQNEKFGEKKDVIGALIYLKPPKPMFLQSKPNEGDQEVSDGSFIEFFKNGVKQEHLFMDILEGKYHAGVSLYMNA
eukprot:CAMPEP_0170563892 /NCGR_PEP_ID=MMETSP0211-20121228/69626_1 /TAXON_ID=311385 /ORGANISM="Pseudokeronopsis sp., Strain OXSARD2" /LENGTH=102 /DNA_ID=CAMNT_0010882685 /DNA_START=305 /DNA_END=613 /DNA_ORIENTATION=-